MRFSSLLSAVAASLFLSSVQATSFDDLHAYLAANPSLKKVSSESTDFKNWKPTAFTATSAVNTTTAPVLPKAYIVQLIPNTGLTRRSEAEHAEFHKRASKLVDYSTRYQFTDSSVFFGLSIQVHDDSNVTTLQDLPNVLKVWPIRIIPRPEAVTIAPGGVYNDSGTLYNFTATAGRGADVNSPHSMTDVDRLHALGIKGKGIKIGIIDTGVDWRHPALGGCFGTGCKISFGRDFVGDDYDSTGVAVQDSDPLATCVGGGHGSHVSGIIGMQDPAGSTFGLVGVAPEADIGMYRVFGCSGGATEDVLYLGFQQAVDDGVDILSLSLGSTDQWEGDDPFADVTSAVVAAGIVVVIANGNVGGVAAITSSPAIGKDVLAVGCAQNSKFPVVYSGRDSNGRQFKYSGDPWPVQAPSTGLKVYNFTVLAANTSSPLGCSAEAWAAASDAVTDKNNAIIVAAMGGDCSAGTKINAAPSYGFKYSAVYALDDSDIYDKDYTTLEPSPNTFGITLSASDGKTLAAGLASTKDYKLFFPTNVYESSTQLTSGFVSDFSSMGPTSDTLKLKPQLSAPGESILSTWPLDATGYAILSGTSMATPYVAGALALVKSQFPTATVQELREILQGSTRAVPYAYDGRIRASAAQQGAGLLNVYNAVKYESVVSPTELNLGDLDALKPQQIKIINKSTRTKTYIISHDGAGEINILPNQYGSTVNTALVDLPGQYAYYATVAFSTQRITLNAGQSANITVTFTPPHDIADKYLPVYSGFITITNNNDQFRVPYIGQPYSRAKADYIDATANSGSQMPMLLSSGNWSAGVRDIWTFNFDYDTPTQGYPFIDFITLQSIQYFRIDLVPYNTSFIPDYYGFNRNGSNPYGVPASALPLVYANLPINSTEAGLEAYGIWSEEAAWTHPAIYTWGFDPHVYDHAGNAVSKLVDGDYRAVLRVLRWGADPDLKESYQSWLSPLIRVAL